MVMKTLIFATCAAMFAGGVVYFGTETTENGGSARIEASDSRADKTGSKDIISRYIASDDKDAEALAGSEGDNPYVVDAAVEHPHPPIKSDEAPDVVGADENRAKNERQIDPTDGEDAATESPSAEIKPATVVENTEINRTAAETRKKDRAVDQRTRTTKPLKISDKKQVVADHSKDPAQLRINAVFEQAENISQPDLRDRAYLDLVDYATSKGMFREAERAALKIQQIELRDTARSRIAMGLARFGDSEKAFSLIEDVEIDELRDVMRLQVIEALLGTDGRR